MYLQCAIHIDNLAHRVVETGWKPSETEQRYMHMYLLNRRYTHSHVLFFHIHFYLLITRTQRQIELEKDPERLTATLRQVLRQIKVIKLHLLLMDHGIINVWVVQNVC